MNTRKVDQNRSSTIANALLICVSTLLLVVGVNFARSEIGAMVKEEASLSAHKWATHLVANHPHMIEMLNKPFDGTSEHLKTNGSAAGNIVTYRIFDTEQRLRIRVGPEGDVETDHLARISLPLMSGTTQLGTLVADVDSSKLYSLFMEGAAKIGLILASALGFIILVSLLVRASAQQEAQRNIQRLTQNDVITGLPNEIAFKEILDTFHDQEVQSQSGTCMILINLDRFSGINERLGRNTGDHLLRMVAERLRTACADSSICARLGGDTFAVATTLNSDVRLEQQLQAVFVKPFEVGKQPIRLSASYGVAISNNGIFSTEELQQQAEVALRAAKSNGGQQLVTYDSDTTNKFRETDRIAALVEDAMANNRFELHYQPVVDSRTRKLVSFEALIRLTSPEGERIPPDRFIPIAEHNGCINEIGLWTLREACRTVAGLPNHISIAVNLSPQQFTSTRLVDDITEILAETRVDPARLELEVTESIMIGDTAPALEQLRKLQALGVRIALDDFGTGYSSLGYLWQFNFDKLKIDQAFIRASDKEPKALALLGKIVEVGRTFNMKITAEGIETEEHAERAAYLGCDYSQGYLFGKAIPQTSLASVVISEFAEYIKRQTNGTARVEVKPAKVAAKAAS